MFGVTLENQPMAINGALFAAAAGVIWVAGTALERQADAIATRTGLGQAFLGILLLATATSLPEIATTITAVQLGNLDLAVHNLLGSVVFNTAVLAVADIVGGPWALTHRSPSFALLMQGVGVVFLLAIIHMGAAIGEGVASASASGWTPPPYLWGFLTVAAYLALLFASHRSQRNPRWRPGDSHAAESDPARPADQQQQREGDQRGYESWSSRRLYAAVAGASLAVLAGGWTVAQSGDALAKQTGLGGSFVGFTLVAIATTLPEISTTVAAARSANYEMAVSNIFGSSAFVLMLLGIIGGEAIARSAVPSASFAAALGTAVTLAYLWGLLERQDRTVFRMGWDSAAVVVLVVGGSWVMYALR